MMKLMFGLVAALSATAAQAHYLWIEQPATGNAIIHFGEFNEGVIEKSPGRMDEMPSIEAFAGGKPLTVTKQATQYLLLAPTGKTALTAREGDYAVKDWTASGIGIAKPIYYARFGPGSAGATPSLDLDIIPAADGKSVQVWLRGKPLAGATVSLHARNGWSKSDKADVQGRMATSMPWRGQYVVEVIHPEKQAGVFGGKSYDIIRHRATLTMIQRKGAATFAVAPPVHHD
jgi:Domain of unknown function (DUF4198)